MTAFNDPGRSNDSEGVLNDILPANGDNHQHSSDDSSDDEDDQNIPNGYQPLSQNAPNGFINDDSDSNNSDNELEEDPNRFPVNFEAPLSPEVQNMVAESARAQRREETEERARIWATDPAAGSGKDNIELDGSTVESIRSAMAGFRLPEGATPSWAKDLTEEQWKDMVSKRLNKKS